MTMTPTMITFDSVDPASLGRWWAERTGGTMEYEYDGSFCIVALPDSDIRLSFQLVDSPTPGKARIHVDLIAPDLDTEIESLLRSGASDVQQHKRGDFRWATLADPDGNVFCVSGPR